MRTHIGEIVGLVLLVLACNAQAQKKSDLLGIEWVVVGDPGNPPDDQLGGNGYGAVSYPYRIMKYELTNALFAAYLRELDDEFIPASISDDIHRDGTVVPGRENYPVVGVPSELIRGLANWLNSDGETHEDGVYNLESGNYIRHPAATYWIPSADEWHKAAFFQGFDSPAGEIIGTDYAKYPTGKFTANNDPPPGDSASMNYGTGELLPPGSYPDAVGHYGTYDMGANVGERIESIRTSSPPLTTMGGNVLFGGDTPDASANSRAPQPSSSSRLGVRLCASIIPEVPTVEVAEAIAIKVDSEHGAKYRLQVSTDMETWEDDELIIGTGEVITLLREQDTDRKFWRVVAL